MKRTFLFLSIFFTFSSFAQDTTLYQGPTVIVHKDPRVDALVKKQASINSAFRKAAGRTMRGYRLLIINTNSRDEAIAAKTKIYTYFSDQKSYLAYQAPFFKLKAGNYQTREEAKKYQDLMKTLFPKGVFIINDTIEVKPEKEVEEN
jgi:hypothetical protein